MAREETAVGKESMNANWTSCWRPWEHRKVLGGKGADAQLCLGKFICVL